MRRSDDDNKRLFAAVLLDARDVKAGIDTAHGANLAAAAEAHRFVDSDQRKLGDAWYVATSPAAREAVTDQALRDGRAWHEVLFGAPPLPSFYAAAFRSSQPIDRPKEVSLAGETIDQAKLEARVAANAAKAAARAAANAGASAGHQLAKGAKALSKFSVPGLLWNMADKVDEDAKKPSSSLVPLAIAGAAVVVVGVLVLRR